MAVVQTFPNMFRGSQEVLRLCSAAEAGVNHPIGHLSQVEAPVETIIECV
jgi:hypothetical protein